MFIVTEDRRYDYQGLCGDRAAGQQRRAVAVGQADVEQDQIELLLRQGGAPCRGVAASITAQPGKICSSRWRSACDASGMSSTTRHEFTHE